LRRLYPHIALLAAAQFTGHTLYCFVLHCTACLQYEDEEEEEEDAAGQAARLKERQRLEQDDQMFPDEVRAVHAVPMLCMLCSCLLMM
jgi:hypothetical protein